MLKRSIAACDKIVILSFEANIQKQIANKQISLEADKYLDSSNIISYSEFLSE